MDGRLVLVDDLSKSLVYLASMCSVLCLNSRKSRRVSARLVQGIYVVPTEFLLNPFSFTPESGLVLFDSVLLLETLGNLKQPATFACDCVGFHGENSGMGNLMGKTVFFGWTVKPILKSNKGQLAQR